MNRARVAQLIREVDALDHALALELALEIIEAPGNDVEPSKKAKRDRRTPELVRPAGEATPIVKAMAARTLRKNGWR